MKPPLSSVILFALVIPVMMTYRLGPGDTPYWLFGLVFGLLLLHFFVKGFLKSILLWLIILLVIGGAYYSAIVVRHQTAPIFNVHDIILQLESAIQFFLQGKNPYAATYFNTPLEQWHYSTTAVNPALFHFVMPPFYLLFSLPFYFFSITFFGFFDARLPLVFLFAFFLFLASRLLAGQNEKRQLFITLLAFNPATVGYFLEGRSDIFMFAFLFWSFYLLEKKRFALAGIPLALAMATKQSSWPLFPFYMIFLWVQGERSWKQLVKNFLPFLFVFTSIMLPFLLWYPKAFLESTVLYLSGNTANSYPISGYGWGMVLNSLGIIRDLQGFYPFLFWQLAICLPVGFVLVRWLLKVPTVSRLVFVYGIFTFVFWYFSRYFNNSHLGYLSMVFLVSYFWPASRGEPNTNSHAKPG